MLDTLLQIGKIFREAKRLKHHRYIKPAPEPDPKRKTIIKYLSLPVKEDFTFDFENIKEIPENERSGLYYFTFKTSDADGLVKYLFGDILYGLDKDGKELGYYRMGKPANKQKAYQISSFYRCKEDAKFFEGKSDVIIKFRAEYEKNINRIEFLLLRKDGNGNDFGYFPGGGKATKMMFIHFEETLDNSQKVKLQETLAKVSVILQRTNGDIRELKKDGGLQYEDFNNKKIGGLPIGHFRISQSLRVSCIFKDKKLTLRRYGAHDDVNDNP